MADIVTETEETPTAIRPPLEDREHSAIGLADREEPELVEADLLVEDVSIDGMCGVY